MDADQFLRAIFDQCQGVVVTCNAHEGFKARRWKPGKPLKGPVYYCISTVQDTNPRDDVLPRQAQNLVKTYAAVLDDVGTKVSRETLKGRLLPTLMVRTSMPGGVSNEQWIYGFDEGVEPARAAALIEALAQAGLTDAGARRADRIMRLPGSLNEKYSPPFVCEVIPGGTGRFYAYSEVAAGLKVTPTDTPALPTGPMPLPDGMIDPIDAWNYDNDRVTGPMNARGWYAVTCPLEYEHTGDVAHGCDYKPGLPGVFKCQHEHRGQTVLTTAWYRAWILEQDPAADLSLIPRQALEELGAKLASALGVRSPAPSADQDGVNPTQPGAAPAGQPTLSEKAFKALQEQIAAGGLFRPPPEPKSPAQLLAAHLSAIQLSPEMLPDADMQARDKVALKQGTTDPRVHHVMTLIGMHARHNVLTGKTEVSFDGYGDLGDEDAEAGVEGLVHACQRCGMSNSNAVRQAMARWSMSHRYSPVSEWICSAPWDGRSRLKDLCASLTMRNVAQHKWRDIVIRRWLIQTIAAIRNWEPGDPPEDVGHVMVLQGRQGIGKSRWIGSLMPAPWVSIGMSLHLDKGQERDAVYRVTQAPITELGELDSSFKRSDTAALRNFLTTKVDTYRPPYAKRDIARPRCTSFTASVNPEGFLTDHTGNRRFWPLAVAACNWEHGVDMQQLWAEAWVLEERGEQFWLQPDEIELHVEITSGHTAASDVGYIMEDLLLRAKTCELKDYVHTNAKELTTRYQVKGMISVYADLNVLLERAKFEGAKVRGKKGFWVPRFDTTLTAGQANSLRVITGGFDRPNKSK